MAALDLLGRRWALRVMWELRDEPLGFRRLQERCDAMSSSVLAQRLRELQDALVLAVDEQGKWALTPLGRDLLDALAPLDAWSRRWGRAVARRAT
jgi:DNA-binding HxlR family transcriptional regulator